MSSSDQVRKGDSLETQQTNGIDFCNKHGFDYQIYRDEGKSAKTDNRDSYQSLLNDVKCQIISGIWVVNLDRLNRNIGNSQEFLQIAVLYGIDVYESGVLIDFDDINGRLGYNFKSMFAEYTRENIRITSIIVRKGRWKKDIIFQVRFLLDIREMVKV